MDRDREESQHVSEPNVRLKCVLSLLLLAEEAEALLAVPLLAVFVAHSNAAGFRRGRGNGGHGHGSGENLRAHGGLVSGCLCCRGGR